MKKLLAKIVIFSFAFNVFAGFALAMYPPQTKIHDANLLVDGDMEASGTSAWKTSTSATLTKVLGGAEDGHNVLRIAYGGTSTPNAQPNPDVVVVGKTYRISGYARGDGTRNPQVTANGVNWTGTSSIIWQRFDFVVAPNATNRPALQCNTSVAGYCDFDDITVTEYSQTKIRDVSRSLSFDGITSRVNISVATGAPIVASSTSITIATRIKKIDGTTGRFFSRFHGDVSNRTPNFAYSTTAGYQFYTQGTTSGANKIDSNIKTLNAWVYLVGTWDKSTGLMNFYVNGSLVGVYTYPAGENSVTGSSSPIFMNTADSGNIYIPGFLDDSRVWNRALSASEVSSLYRGIVPRSGLVGEWLFNESPATPAYGTTTYDTSGQGNHGTITGATYSTDTPVDGFAGDSRNPTKISNVSRSLSFLYSGTATNVRNTSVIPNWDSSLTVTLKYKVTPNASAGTNFQLLNIGGTSGSSDPRIGVSVTTSTGNVRVGYYNGSTYSATKSKIGSLTNWNTLVFTFDGSAIRIWINGVEGTAASSPISGSFIGILVGSQSGANFSGFIKDVNVWSSILTDSQIAGINRGIYPKGQYLSWGFNESPATTAYGTTAYDTSGNNNRGTITGATYSTDVPNTP